MDILACTVYHQAAVHYNIKTLCGDGFLDTCRPALLAGILSGSVIVNMAVDLHSTGSSTAAQAAVTQLIKNATSNFQTVFPKLQAASFGVSPIRSDSWPSLPHSGPKQPLSACRPTSAASGPRPRPTCTNLTHMPQA